VATESLTALDATFLELEEADQSAHMHIGGVMIFDPLPDGGAPSVPEMAHHLEKRLPRLPRYVQRLSEPHTGGLHWPDWETVSRFDPASHIRRAALPAPGGEAELLAWAGEYFSQRLDRARPLWEMVILEGLAGRRWALVSKTHHCMVDGVGSVDVAHLILDPEPVPPGGRRIGGPGPTHAEGDDPVGGGLRSRLHLLESGVRGAVRVATTAVTLPLKVAGSSVGVATHPERARDALHKSRAIAEVLVRDEVEAAPATSLNEPIGSGRRLSVLRVPLADLRDIKSELGGTINDVVLAIATSGLRDLLLSRGEPLPPRGLRAMVPMNIRVAGEHLELGNKITSLFVHLPVAERDTIALYRRQVAETKAQKSGRQATGSKSLIDLTALAPPILHSFLAQSLFATRLFNVTVTNVPGPADPLYAFGSRMREVWPLVPLAASHAIGLAVLSYDGTLFFCVNADLATVPDLAVLRDGMAGALKELREESM
jgi:diacylglycerol O-acyltransferase